MTAIYFDQKIDDDTRRQRLYDGDIFVYSANEHSLALIEVARKLIVDALSRHRSAHGAVPVRRARSSPRSWRSSSRRSSIIPSARRSFRGCCEAIGCDLDQIHFDIPRMRTSTSNDYLTTGIAYAFHPHRDTWYSAPMCQINWWLPIFDIEAGNAMAFHPNYFGRGVHNDSEHLQLPGVERQDAVQRRRVRRRGPASAATSRRNSWCSSRRRWW